ncbi:DPEP2 neighbor protein-like isoform X3 [Fukomys damarensis]|uniref:DPEP2 neighbor protein-like isoform X3 n=1 Tax=Fukomys damarensis TaxID=885580 RepID=UPI001455D1D9|nr:DPEP2 neighbor protein-like isoform X3 [Fukomys damarensis]
MSDQISYIQAKLPPFSWECNPAAAVLPTAPPIPVYYHVRYRGCTETQPSKDRSTEASIHAGSQETLSYCRVSLQ